MLPNAVFSLANASPEQAIAFVGFAIFTIGFFVWVAYPRANEVAIRSSATRHNQLGRFGRIICHGPTILCSSRRALPGSFHCIGMCGGLPARSAATRIGHAATRPTPPASTTQAD